MSNLQRTPLYEEHQRLGAKMVDFANWEMPIQYSAINKEHIAVRERAGLFDVSHMGQVYVRGEGAAAFLSYATLNDPSKLRLGRGHYNMLPNATGGLIDDLYIYRETDETFLVVCNAANRQAVVSHLENLSQQGNAVTVDDDSDAWALVALQGPQAPAMLQNLCSFVLSDLKKNRFADLEAAGCAVRVARTGYTGEDGFEIFIRPDDAPRLWRALIDQGVEPCGLGARDTLRLEAGFPLFGHEFTEVTNPLCSSFHWVIKDKPFYGRDAMWNASCSQRLVNIKLIGKGVPRDGYTVYAEGKPVGTLSSGTLSPSSKQGIGMAWIDAPYAKVGTDVSVEIRGKQIPAHVVDALRD